MNLSPTVHEATIARHIVKDADDPTLQSLHDAVKQTRELATKAAATTDIVLKNEMRTMAARHKDARAASFELLKRATQSIDQAVKTAQGEIAAIRAKTKGPPASKDAISESREREIRERLYMLPPERRDHIISSAIKNDEQLLLSAVLNSDAWLSGLTDNELAMHRHSWASKNHAPDLDRLERLSKAVDDANRAGSVALAFVDGLTDADLVSKAEQMEKQATAALAAVK
jgi:replicative superfamily II helicase